MGKKVLLILCDGLRPDSVESCGMPFVETLLSTYAYAHGSTVFPSITLPCHMSLFQSADTSVHGVTDNNFVPSAGGRYGLFEHLHALGKSTAMFYSWGELRDIHEPYSVSYSSFAASTAFGGSEAERILTENAAELIRKSAPDFVFLYLENTDSVGHTKGWCSPEYMEAIRESFGFIEKIVSVLPEDYSVIITADHGGHEFTHGTTLPADMTIPVFVKSQLEIDPEHFKKMNIIDIAPSICQLCGIEPPKNFAGRSIFVKK